MIFVRKNVLQVLKVKRDAIKQLIDWKNSKRRKPLILQGAR